MVVSEGLDTQIRLFLGLLSTIANKEVQYFCQLATQHCIIRLRSRLTQKRVCITVRPVGQRLFHTFIQRPKKHVN